MTRTANTVLALWVEANGLVRLKLTQALEREGFVVLWATTLEEAVKASEGNRVDLLLADLHEPLASGSELLGRLRPLKLAIPLVLVAEAKTEFEAWTEGRVVTTLQKPFRLSALIQTVNALLTQGKQGPAHRV
jgi:DNA-binding response OmpR family regulator